MPMLSPGQSSQEERTQPQGTNTVALGTQRGSGDRDGRPDLLSLTHLRKRESKNNQAGVAALKTHVGAPSGSPDLNTKQPGQGSTRPWAQRLANDGECMCLCCFTSDSSFSPSRKPMFQPQLFPVSLSKGEVSEAGGQMSDWERWVTAMLETGSPETGFSLPFCTVIKPQNLGDFLGGVYFYSPLKQKAILDQRKFPSSPA